MPAWLRLRRAAQPWHRLLQMMRNALGANEGGSGVVLKRAEYDASVAFWSKFAPIK